MHFHEDNPKHSSHDFREEAFLVWFSKHVKRYAFAHEKNTEVKHRLTFHRLLFSHLDSAAAAAAADA